MISFAIGYPEESRMVLIAGRLYIDQNREVPQVHLNKVDSYFRKNLQSTEGTANLIRQNINGR